jgi:hypothetical protein
VGGNTQIAPPFADLDAAHAFYEGVLGRPSQLERDYLRVEKRLVFVSNGRSAAH